MIRKTAALVAALGLVLGACSSATGQRPADRTDHGQQAERIVAGPGGDDFTLPAPVRPAFPVVATAEEERPPFDSEVVAIPLERYTLMWPRPGAREPAFAFDTRNPLGKLAPMLVADTGWVGGETWYEVYLPLRPNGRTAWVREQDVKTRKRNGRIEVDLSKRVLRYMVDGELVQRMSVGVGTEATPTGTGTFYVWVKVPYENPDQAYGVMALGLSGFSPVLSDWPGGGRMAVHGTPRAADRGKAVSHGCVRVFNGDMRGLLRVPLGTPVIISR